MITGDMLIEGGQVRGGGQEFQAVGAATGAELPTLFCSGTEADVERAAALAWSAFDVFRESGLEARANFLERIAARIGEIGDVLVTRCSQETGLPAARVMAERERTIGQLKMFADEVRNGAFQSLRFDAGDPERKPFAKPDLKLRNVPLGPVAVFGASNFPLAFSVAGGDTASALAAGCPVIVKAHPAHPGTSELVGRAVQLAVKDCGLHPGVFAMLHDAGFGVGQALVADPRIRAVGFTGSRRGGLALLGIAARRKQPIPVYAEMSSINPVILFPDALRQRAEAVGRAFVGSLTLGAGQFCTNPGLVLAVEDEGLDRFKAAAVAALAEVPAQPMLTSGIFGAFCEGVNRLKGHNAVRQIGRGASGGPFDGVAALFETTGEAFRQFPELGEEVFGASGLIVSCRDEDELASLLDAMEGQLTIALHVADGDLLAAGAMVPKLEMLAGRLLVNGFATGVEVSPAMVHGGPYPATSDGRSTSVGTLAIYRFLRPVSYQDFPDPMLPAALRR